MPLTKAFYAIEAMGLVDKLHHDIFTAIHQQKVRMNESKVLFDWMASKGVDRQKFIDTYNSFAVQGRAQRSVDGVLRAAESFATLGDRDVTEGALHMARKLTAGDASARAQVETDAARIAARVVTP